MMLSVFLSTIDRRFIVINTKTSEVMEVTMFTGLFPWLSPFGWKVSHASHAMRLSGGRLLPWPTEDLNPHWAAAAGGPGISRRSRAELRAHDLRHAELMFLMFLFQVFQARKNWVAHPFATEMRQGLERSGGWSVGQLFCQADLVMSIIPELATDLKAMWQICFPLFSFLFEKCRTKMLNMSVAAPVHPFGRPLPSSSCAASEIGRSWPATSGVNHRWSAGRWMRLLDFLCDKKQHHWGPLLKSNNKLSWVCCDVNCLMFDMFCNMLPLFAIFCNLPDFVCNFCNCLPQGGGLLEGQAKGQRLKPRTGWAFGGSKMETTLFDIFGAYNTPKSSNQFHFKGPIDTSWYFLKAKLSGNDLRSYDKVMTFQTLPGGPHSRPSRPHRRGRSEDPRDKCHLGSVDGSLRDAKKAARCGVWRPENFLERCAVAQKKKLKKLKSCGLSC